MVEERDTTELPEFQVHVRESKSHKLSRETTSCPGRLFSENNRTEIRELFTLAWPTVLSYFFFHLVSMICLFFAGHLGKVELAAGTLAISFINIAGPSLFIGLGSAVETLCSQAYGARNYRLVGVVLQRGVWILGITCILTWTLWINTELLLLMVHQKKKVAQLAQEFVLICLPASIGSFLFVLLQRYLQSQGIVKPILYVCAISNVIQIGVTALMILGFNVGFSGVAISWALSTGMMFLLLFAYMKVFKLDEACWPGWSTESLLHWDQFFKLAMSGMVMICIEWWSFELGAFLTGTFGEVELGAYGILLQWSSFVFMIPLGLSVATGVRVGNFLGAGNPQAVKRTIKVALGLTVGIELVVFAVFFGLQDLSARVFTNNSDVLAAFKKHIRIVAAFYFFDGIQGVCSGVVRGSGRQKIGVLINFISYCCIGLPLGVILLFFVFREATGLWIGLFSGVVAQASLYLTLLWRTDWEKQAELARQRIAAKSVTDPTSESLLNGDCHRQKVNHTKKEEDVLLASWIYKTSSLPFLDRFNADRRVLFSTDMNAPSECNGQLEPQQNHKSHSADSYVLTSSQKKSLTVKRLIPLVISLLVLGGAVAIRFLIPLPSSSEVTMSVGNATVNLNSTHNLTANSPV